ncbi:MULTISPECIES: hypothetical protein [unclassified Methylobacterium]|uniref:hypothetical protein n=1 Tax=unclassified Methylobacterium TaxID=2615210 RepID=UPI0011C1D28C|nr:MULTISPECIES: hypothetical protein [unclassified Methylobacterium]QEE41615.1 hypothetical protein FVA80_24370 [Methylobacterium sp. WL1]TXN57251.1 hypothetical protein FV241_12110 [Methylobacterium sp. WL2]
MADEPKPADELKRTDELKPTLEQVRASVRDALEKLTGDPGPEPGITPSNPRGKRRPELKPEPDVD